MYLRLKRRQECMQEFQKAVQVLDAQPDPSQEDDRAKMIRKMAAKVTVQLSKSVKKLNNGSKPPPN